jgi:hypothetical protein
MNNVYVLEALGASAKPGRVAAAIAAAENRVRATVDILTVLAMECLFMDLEFVGIL